MNKTTIKAALLAALLTAGASWAIAADGGIGSTMALADSLASLGRYAEAAALCEEAFASGQPDGTDYYALAGYWAMSGEAGKAFECLEESRLMQGLDLTVLARDENLAGLRDDPRWKQLQLRQCDDEFDMEEPTGYEHFNAAQCYALAGDPDRSIERLGKALDAGFTNELLMLRYSPALEPLREREEWAGLEKRLRENIDRAIAGKPVERTVTRTVALPDPALDGGVSIEKVLHERRSVRSYDDAPATLEECSQLLWAAYGITFRRDKMPDFLRGGLRTAPSAGARYPLDLYLVSWNVTGLDDGIYFYDSEKHELGLMAEGDFREQLSQACWWQDWLKGGAAAIVYSAVYERNTSKYGDRGRERYVCMDLGHSGENVYLQCGSLGLGTCAIGAFLDLELSVLIGMTTEEEPLYVMPFGRLKKE